MQARLIDPIKQMAQYRHDVQRPWRRSSGVASVSLSSLEIEYYMLAMDDFAFLFLHTVHIAPWQQIQN